MSAGSPESIESAIIQRGKVRSARAAGGSNGNELRAKYLASRALGVSSGAVGCKGPHSAGCRQFQRSGKLGHWPLGAARWIFIEATERTC